MFRNLKLWNLIILTIICITTLSVICFVGCEESKKPADITNSEYFDMEYLTDSDSALYSIVYDKNTGVIYYYNKGLYPIYNADGSLKNIDQYDKASIEENIYIR